MDVIDHTRAAPFAAGAEPQPQFAEPAATLIKAPAFGSAARSHVPAPGLLEMRPNHHHAIEDFESWGESCSVS